MIHKLNFTAGFPCEHPGCVSTATAIVEESECPNCGTNNSPERVHPFYFNCVDCDFSTWDADEFQGNPDEPDFRRVCPWHVNWAREVVNEHQAV